MAGYNRIIIVGNLTRDPEYKQLTTGQALTKLGLATNRQYKNKQSGALVQEVCYIDAEVWGPQAESCRQYLQKGRPVLVEGRLKFDSWKDAEGQTRSKHIIVADKVVFLSSSAPGVDISSEDMSDTRVEPKNQLEKDLLDQLEEIKSRSSETEKKVKKTSAAKKAKDSDFEGSGEIEFKDEPPFQDDLPF